MKDRKQACKCTKLEGVIVAAVTPRRPQEHCIDIGASLELIDFLCSTGVSGIALFGSTGEFVDFGLDDRRQMVHLAARRSRVPLLVNVSHSTLDGAIELARDSVQAGVAGLLLMPPYYFRHSREEIRSFYRAFAAEIGDSTRTYLYNIPIFTNEIAIATATELLTEGLYAGIKDSSGNMDYFRSLQEAYARKPFTLFAGLERLYVQQRRMGAHGTISGVSSAVPELIVALDQAVVAGDEQRIAKLEPRLAELSKWFDRFSWPVGVKEALSQRKLKGGARSMPLGAEGDRQLAEFGAWFREWLPGMLRDCRNEPNAGR
jgi:N-acetylneuraminate lyase